MATHPTGSDPSDETPLTKEEIKRIVDEIREEFERTFHTIPDPVVRKQRVEQSLTNNKIQKIDHEKFFSVYL